MNKSIFLALPFVLLTGGALAQNGPGSGTDMLRVNREIEAMTRDGRWERLLEEGRANKQAFENLKAREAAGSVAPSGYSRQPRRRK